jgi:hypothetical protein
MICVTDCTEAKCLITPSNCSTVADLYIGDLVAGDYTVYIYNETTNKTYAEDYTVGGYGTLDISLLDYGDIFNPHGIYYLWVTALDANMVEQEAITNNVLTYTCFILTFERVFVNGVVECPETQAIEI